MSEQKECEGYYLDITSETCPMTFVRTRLMLDRMPAGAVLTIRLKGREPLDSVPRSAAALGHAVLGRRPEDAERATPGDVWLVTLRKAG